MNDSALLDFLTVPCYSFNFSRPVVGFGNFTYSLSQSSHFYFDSSLVHRKLSLWDYVIDHNLMDHPNANIRAKAVSLLNDKTIKAYALFRVDDEPIRLMPVQDAVMSDTHDRILFAGCNQHIGKSFTLNVDAATDFVTDHSKNWVGILVSGSLPQSQFQMERIKMLLKSTKFSYREENTTDSRTGKKDNTTQLSYTFYSSDGKTPLYRNLLICCPHTSSALGYPADVMWLDEFDFWENCDQNRFMFQIAIPRTFRTGGRIKIYTNPDGKDKMLHTLWQSRDGNDSPAWHRYQFNYWDKPGATQGQFDKSIVGMTRNQVESTLLAVFTRTEGSFFSSDEIRDMVDQDLADKGDQSGYGRDTAWFLDVGSVRDQSVLIGAYLEDNLQVPDIPLIKLFWIHKYPVGYPLSRVVGIETGTQDDDGWGEESKDNPSVKQVLAEYSSDQGQPLFGFDVTGNAGMIPLFQAAGVEGVDITFSGPKKWAMYQRYQYYVQQRFIKRAKERDYNTVGGSDFDYQMSKLTIRKQKVGGSRYRQIHHEKEGDLDDTQDSVAGVIHLIENPDMPSLSFDIIPHTQVANDQPGAELDVEGKSLKGQYIPSYVNKSELQGWLKQRELYQPNGED